MPRRRLGFAIAASSLGVAFACSRFDAASPAATADEGGLPEAGADVPVPALYDAGGEEAGGPLPDGTYLPCPPTKAGVSYTTKTVLAAAPSSDVEVEFPFQVTTDHDHVYWIAQYAPLDIDSSSVVDDAYNGKGAGRLHRIAKNDKGGVPDTLADNLLMAEAVALDGNDIYFTYIKEGIGVVARVARDCKAPCAPDVVHKEPNLSSRITRMYRAAPGVLVLRADDGRPFVFRPETRAWLELENPNGNGFAVTNEDVFLANANSDELLRVSLEGQTTTSTIPDWTNQKGVSPIATDCKSIFAYRSEDKSIWQSPRSDIRFQSWAKSLQVGNVYELVADAEYVYVGQPNGFGILAVPIAGGNPKSVTSGGSYWRLVADESGLYGGDHGELKKRTGGAMHHFH